MGLALWAAVGLTAQTGYRPPPKFIDGGKPDQAEGARILVDFQRAGIAGTYWLAFELHVMPRHGADRTIPGELWGTRGNAGPLTRLHLGEQRWLIQSGAHPAAWMAGAGATAAASLSASETLQPLAGTDVTVFDLQMPFLYWTDFAYEGLARVRGRPAHSFVLYPPADAALPTALTGVRVLIDTQFQALMQAELLGAAGRLEKTISVLDLKKVGEQWLVKSLDVRNAQTRDKTRFTLTAAALDLRLPDAAFSPESLMTPAPAVPAEAVQRF